MSIPSKTSAFANCVRTIIEINKIHIKPDDWNKLTEDFHTDQLWQHVPKEDCNYLEGLVRQGHSYAYTSLLLSCARNQIAYIHFADFHDLTKGLPRYDDTWINHELNCLRKH
jgi:hypothetical protein